MTVLFSAREIVEAAVEKERKRREFYARVSELSTNEDLRSLFQFLMEEEERHVAAFEQIRDKLPVETHAAEYDEDMQAYMDSVIDDRLYSNVDSREFVQKAIQTESVIRLAIGFEKDAILYFMEFLPHLTESDRKIVSELIEEEKGHIRKLASLQQGKAK
ncbi:MAG: ferritin family protein [Deltaproteobacteria bacterium]|nr:ferritin family protein [Deltaproteobacteria bacterium]